MVKKIGSSPLDAAGGGGDPGMPKSSKCTGCGFGRVWRWLYQRALVPFALFLANLLTCFQIRRRDPRPPSLSEILSQVPSQYPKLAPSDDKILTHTLVNLGSTCGFNSLLQKLAHEEVFDPMLLGNSELENRPFKTKDLYADKVEYLRRQLCWVIHLMRLAEVKTPVTEKHLNTLYRLLRECGWKYPYSEQQDPQELLLFLLNILGQPKGLTIHTVQSRTYELKNGDKVVDFSDREMHSEWQLNLTHTDGQLRNTYGPINDLMNEHTKSSLKLKIEGEDKRVRAATQTYFLDPAPSTLILQEVRFRCEEQKDGSYKTSRINGAIPSENEDFLKSIHLKIFELKKQNDRSLLIYKETREYAPHTVINHRGSTLKEGHYNASVNQGYKTETEQWDWVLYDDDSRQQAGSLKQLTYNGYLIAYRLIGITPATANNTEVIEEDLRALENLVAVPIY